ncbi:MAG TPA: META domain-containing protein [Anaerolineales bacterium]|nr:META domain-containing protein [Anaerolineales bacterium]
MTFEKKITSLGISLFVVLIAACAPFGPGVPVTGETSVPGTPPASPDLPPKAVLDAQEWLATQLSTARENVQIIEVEQAEWTDSCLGLGRANEICAQVITPGWRVVFEVGGQRYELRTDETASTIRLASPEGTPGAAGVTLENIQWNLVSFGPLDTGTPVIEGSTVTLMLENGQAGGTGGCNSYGGTYTVEGGNISFDEITRTLRACADETVTQQEDRYLQALESASRYELDGNNLRIWYDDEASVLVFETPLPAGPGGPLPVVETVTPSG